MPRCIGEYEHDEDEQCIGIICPLGADCPAWDFVREIKLLIDKNIELNNGYVIMRAQCKMLVDKINDIKGCGG